MAEIVRSAKELSRRMAKAKKEGKKIVFANGVFDILHVGHIRYLRGAKALGDILVVAVNSDKSVKKLKNPHLPVTPQNERLEILSCLEFIDYLIPFEDQTVDRILRVIKPDIHAKGSDYTKKTVPERETVLSYGGRVAITGDRKSHSTTALIKRIAKLARKTYKTR
jgi:rfaE bifunctional protein nucleotidyltransferase chain/domain